MKKLILFLCCIYTSLIVQADTVILDFETPETSTLFQHFGGSQEGEVNRMVDNPNKNAVNMSDRAIEFTKQEDAPSWAGAFTNPNPIIPINLQGATQICMDVYKARTGKVSFKLEESTTEGGDWVQTVDVETANAWQQVCFDVNLPSIEMPFSPAVGHTFSRITIFFDLGFEIGEFQTNYVDNIVVIAPAEPEESEVTFTVDMKEFGKNIEAVLLQGDFNDWGNTNEMVSNGDGTYTTTVSMTNGVQQYKFAVRSENIRYEEKFSLTSACVVPDESGEFGNRQIVVTEDERLLPVCFNSCYACGESVKLSFHVDMTEQDVSEMGVYLAGGAAFGHGDYPMLDDDGDGVYSISIEREVGFESDFTFINGICLPDWECKENIVGQSCAVAPFNDRHVGPLTSDYELKTCFGVCSEDGSCTFVSDGFEQEELATKVELYPNVVAENTTVHFDESLVQLKQVQLLDLRGKQIANYKVAAHTKQQNISLNGLTTGIYIVRIQIGEEVICRKVVKQ